MTDLSCWVSFRSFRTAPSNQGIEHLDAVHLPSPGCLVEAPDGLLHAGKDDPFGVLAGLLLRSDVSVQSGAVPGGPRRTCRRPDRHRAHRPPVRGVRHPDRRPAKRASGEVPDAARIATTPRGLVRGVRVARTHAPERGRFSRLLAQVRGPAKLGTDAGDDRDGTDRSNAETARTGREP